MNTNGNFTMGLIQNKTLENILILLIAISTALFLLEGNLNATWWLIDDYGIIDLIGENKKINFFDISQILLQETEAGQWGESQRYRPVYYLLRIIEAYSWGYDLSLWYSFRIFIFALFLYSVMWILKDIVGFFYTLLFVLLMLSTHYLHDIFAKLGPSEAYSIFGLSLYMIGVKIYFKYKQNLKIFAVMLVFFGAVILIGSKENMLFIAIISIYRIMFNWNKIFLIEKFLRIFIILFSFFIALSIIIALSSVGTDIYANDVSLLYRLGVMFDKSLLAIIQLKMIIFIPIILFLYIKYFNTKILKHNLFKNFIIITIFAFIFYIGQVVFYNGQVLTNSRYDFPLLLIKEAYIFISLFFIFNIIYLINNNKFLLNIAFSASLLILVPFSYSELLFLKITSNENAIKTQQKNSEIINISKIALKYPQYPIIFESHHAVRDFEAINAVQKYLHFYNAQNNIFLHTNYTKSNDALWVLLSKLLMASSLEGNGEWNIKPLKNLIVHDKKCISVSFSSDASNSCLIKYRIW